jgi:hypothetical protein
MVFSTVFEIDGRPTVYSVYKNGRLAFLSPSQMERAPILFASFSDSSWSIRGTDDGKLVDQVLREISD